MPEEMMETPEKLDNFLFGNDTRFRHKDVAESLFERYRSSPNNGIIGGGPRVSAPANAFKWVGVDDSRFYSWVSVYWVYNLNLPLLQARNDYIKNKYKLLLSIDSIDGNEDYKCDIEDGIKSKWKENIEIDKNFPVLNIKDKDSMSKVWHETLSKFKGTSVYDLAVRSMGGFGSPLTAEDFYYSSLFLFDISDFTTEVKKDIVRGIKKKLSSNKRLKKQVNISLSPHAAKKLTEISKERGCGKSELVENWIMSHGSHLK